MLEPMPKGYIIAHVSVEDAERYAQYAMRAAQAQALFGARVLVRAGRYEILEGQARSRNVILEFPTYEQARGYFHSPEYQAARQFRIDAAIADIMVIEGVDED